MPVRYDDEGHTLADQVTAVLDAGLPAEVLLIASAGLGTDLPRSAGAPLLGALPERTGRAEDFATLAYASLASELGGSWDAEHFAHVHRPDSTPLRSKG
ncbi:hypothetical protein ACFWJ4_30780 [Kitasatospora sp. NPDC127067]|uniref:hypothetical protein n=1 Tax=Kitasatospora sp. NPDC127067 TaxID=3347126 RepID=UPI00365EB633